MIGCVLLDGPKSTRGTFESLRLRLLFPGLSRLSERPLGMDALRPLGWLGQGLLARSVMRPGGFREPPRPESLRAGLLALCSLPLPRLGVSFCLPCRSGILKSNLVVKGQDRKLTNEVSWFPNEVDK
jgi:hypothetical protein